jgi:hypothetical protein
MDIKIDFERGESPNIYKDALYFTVEQFDALTPEEIEVMKDARYNNWRSILENPPTSTEVITPTNLIVIMDETYELLTTVPSSGDKLIEVNNNWYKRVQ